VVLALRNRGVQAALLAAVLFGAGTPTAKLLLGDVSPWLLAGLLYCGSGLGLGLIRLIRDSPAARLQRRELPPLLGAIVFGGIVGPVLLMLGLSNMPASGASLLLNAEESSPPCWRGGCSRRTLTAGSPLEGSPSWPAPSS
jgi:drug/metabolite transporter (DMT)-like permease